MTVCIGEHCMKEWQPWRCNVRVTWKWAKGSVLFPVGLCERCTTPRASRTWRPKYVICKVDTEAENWAFDKARICLACVISPSVKVSYVEIFKKKKKFQADLFSIFDEQSSCHRSRFSRVYGGHLENKGYVCLFFSHTRKYDLQVIIPIIRTYLP